MNALAAFTSTTVNDQFTHSSYLVPVAFVPIVIYTKTVPLFGFVILIFFCTHCNCKQVVPVIQLQAIY